MLGILKPPVPVISGERSMHPIPFPSVSVQAQIKPEICYESRHLRFIWRSLGLATNLLVKFVIKFAHAHFVNVSPGTKSEKCTSDKISKCCFVVQVRCYMIKRSHEDAFEKFEDVCIGCGYRPALAFARNSRKTRDTHVIDIGLLSVIRN